MKEKQPKSYPLRLDHDLSQWVKECAKTGDRSMNAELTRIVRQAKDAAQQQQTEATNPC
ncbi:Arc family DNA-binding protein [Thiothrix fructosivorans]|uniref:Arc family DNA-binding protein n=1 Tax=Thiothrix fructosivorans TaxID=111770 RepID=A0A8B0SM61_9GAMM|nr:Arc family DNA-binding protein [Thiothrix fructosivorans]QTX11580.1 Arc family DNA-binding protein [Thiothrix fructosivorans]